MLRTPRWQILLLLTAVVLFAGTLLSRLSLPQPAPPAATLPSATPTPEPTLTQALQPLPASTAVIIPTFREAAIGRVQRLNPLFANLNPIDRDISALIFEGLTRTNGHGEVIPSLAQSWSISGSGLDYVIELRDDVLWQDGTPLSMADIVYTFSILQSPDFPGDPALGAFWRTVEVQPLSEVLVRFRLTQPLARFLEFLTIGLLPEHALRGTTAAQLTDHPINLAPIGTGPYQLEALRGGVNGALAAVDLRAAPVYRQRTEARPVNIDRFRFVLFDSFDRAREALQTGSVDALASRSRQEAQALANTPNINRSITLQPSIGMVIFNWANDRTRFFREQRVRQSLLLGLDRGPIVERNLTLAAVPASSPLIPGSWGFDPGLPWPLPDAAAARALLESANIQRPEDQAPPVSGALLEFSLVTADDPALVAVAQEIAAQWSALNIVVRVDAAPASTFQSRLENGEFDAALVEMDLSGSSDPDLYQFWNPDEYPDGLNYGGMDDGRIAEALERARQDYSGINRILHYQDFQNSFIARAIGIPLYYPTFVYATTQRVAGVQLGYIATPTDRLRDVLSWSVLDG